MARLLWTLKQHVGPRPRLAHGMAFDSQRRRVVLFGGTDGTAPLGDTWEWDGESWTQMNDIGPRARAEAAMAYDGRRGRTVLFGGTDGTHSLGDTWEWDGQDWTQVADSGPAPRTGHALAFDDRRNRVLLFGGIAAGALTNDTWEWDGAEWVQVEDTGPTPRRAPMMAFDSTRGRIVLFGGIDATGAQGDTWEWDGTLWTQAVNFGPPPCLAGTMIHGGGRSRLFGGISAVTGTPELFGLSWDWDGRHWTVRQDMGPGPRWGHGMAFDSARSRGVLFGGTASSPTADVTAPLGDTWEQFELGAPSPPPPGPTPGPSPGPAPGPVTVTALAVATPNPTEGLPVTLEATLSGASPGAAVTFSLLDSEGVELLLPTEFVADRVPTFPIGPLILSAGNYVATARVGESRQTAALAVARQQGIRLETLKVTPPSGAHGTAFTLTATLSAPAPADMAVPLRVDLGGGPQQWLVRPLQVRAGQSTGTLPLDPELFANVTGTMTWTGSLGGGIASATMTIT